MSDDIRITIALICGAVIFAWLFFFVFLKGKTKGNQLMAKARQSGCITTGKVVKTIIEDLQALMDDTEVRS